MTAAAAPTPSHFGTETLRQRIHIGLIQGFHTAIAAVLAFWLGNRLGLVESYWASISAIVVMQSEYKATMYSSFDRLVGTSIGAVLGWSCARYWNGHIAIYGIAIFFSTFICWALRLGTSGRVCGITVSIITLVVHGGGQVSFIALHRFMDVSLGIFVALFFSIASSEAQRVFVHHHKI